MSGTYFPGVEKLRRRKLIRSLVLIGVLLVVLVASALAWPRQELGPLTVPTSASVPDVGGAVRGVLTVDQRGETACFAVRAAAGQAQLVLPSGWSASRERSLLDPSGSVAARPGDVVLVTGDPGRVGVVDGCGASGRIWSVASITVRT